MIALRLSIQHSRPALSVRLGLAALAVVALIAAGLVGCAGEGGPVDPGGDEVGSIQGTVYAPNGETPVAGARVWVPSAGASARQGTVAETTTDALGRFRLQSLPATVTVNIARARDDDIHYYGGSESGHERAAADRRCRDRRGRSESPCSRAPSTAWRMCSPSSASAK